MEYDVELKLGKGRVLFVVSRFNAMITENLFKAAKACYLKYGGEEELLDVLYVPGAFEIPQAIEMAFSKEVYGGALALGCVIRGETPHFDYICSSTISSLMGLALGHKKPVAMGILTVDTLEQAQQRSGGKMGNKGWDSCLALIEMLSLNEAMEGKTGNGKRNP